MSDTTVYIIDDSEDDLTLTTIALQSIRPDLKIKTALDGQSALQSLLQTAMDPPALVLLDLKLPGMSGEEIIKKIRNSDALKAIPIIIMSSSLLESDKEKALTAGADYFISKSFRFDEICKDMQNVLERWLPSAEP